LTAGALGDLLQDLPDRIAIRTVAEMAHDVPHGLHFIFVGRKVDVGPDPHLDLAASPRRCSTSFSDLISFLMTSSTSLSGSSFEESRPSSPMTTLSASLRITSWFFIAAFKSALICS
jgi:hypothetical protein